MTREIACTVTGIIGSIIASMFGGWNAAMSTLLIFMAIDYISGLIVAGVFKNSRKTESGALQSKAGWKGLCKKGMNLAIILVAYRLDLTIGSTCIKDATIIAFISNELLSICENAGLMGIKLPDVVTRSIDILSRKENK